MEKITIQQAIKRLNTSRATLYKYLRQCGVEASKEGNKTYLTTEQLETIKLAINSNKTEKNGLSKTVKTLQEQLHLVQDKNKELELQKREFIAEKETLSIQNIELRTRAEVLDEQNKKILFQMGSIGRKVAQLELEKAKLLELPAQPESNGVLKSLFSFWKK